MTIEERTAEPSCKKRKCPYLGNRWTDFNETWRVDGYTSGSIILKNQDDQGAQRRVIALSLGSVGPRCEAPGIEGRSAKSRCEAPCIEVRSTELFLFLGLDRRAQH